MHVVVVAHYWHPHVGGVETVAHEQAIRLAALGHQVDVVTSRLRADARDAQQSGYSVHRVRVANLLERYGLPFPLFGYAFVRRLRSVLTPNSILLIHSHGFTSSILAAHVGKRSNVPIVLLQHNPFVRYGAALSIAETLADRSLGAFVLRRASRVLAVSEHTAAYVQRLDRGLDVRVLYSGVDLLRHQPPTPEARARARARFSVSDADFVFVCVRRLFRRNGVESLVTAVSEVPRDLRIRVIIAGDGPEREKLRDLAATESSRITFAGRVSDSDLDALYDAADALVLPTHSGEGFGLVMLEAFAHGVPVITTWAGAQRELVQHGENGVVIEPENAGALAMSMAYVASAWHFRESGRASARERAQTMSWDASVRRLEAILLQAGGTRSPGSVVP